MKTESDSLQVENYRLQIQHCARNLAVARTSAVTNFLDDPQSAEQRELLNVYAEGNLDKRVWKLADQFEFMADEFDELDAWFTEYIRTVPLAAYDTGTSDSIFFLDWVEKTQSLSREQIDLMRCHRGRVAVEELARDHRMGHVRFQELLSTVETLGAELESNPNLWIHLNPIRAWAHFETTVLIDDAGDLPATVIFYPVGSDVRTAVLEPLGRLILGELESLRACHLSDVMRKFPAEQSGAVIEICRDLAETGLIAFG